MSEILVHPLQTGANRKVGIKQDGWNLVAISHCCHAQLGWFGSGGSLTPAGHWFCKTCKGVMLPMTDFRADGFGKYAKSDWEVYSRGGWANTSETARWVAAWMRCEAGDVSLNFDLVET